MTKREVELELELWKQRGQTLQANANSINVQAQLLQLQSAEVGANVQRLEAKLASINAEEAASAADKPAVPAEGQPEPAPT